MGYTNSPLVTYTNLTKNKTTNRKHAIDTITIHCIVGQWTAKQGCDYFATTDRQCSANYVVGKDGSIGLSVEEKDRSWCTSSSANDNRAITIEVASDTKHPYAVTDKAYTALIELVADVCKRNGIKKLVWSENKDERKNHLNGCNMTVHRDYANKSCPGEYLYSRHGEIAELVNKKLNAIDKPALTGTASTGSAADERIIWDFLKSKIGNEFGVSGLMGNLNAESALRSNNLQQTFEKKLNYTDITYTKAVDDGTYTNFVKDGAGYGLAQWTYFSRKQKLLDYARSKNKSISDLQMQLEFLYKELNENFNKSVLQKLKTAKSVREASDIVLKVYEAPSDQSEKVQEKRVSFGEKYYKKYTTKTEQTKPEIKPTLTLTCNDFKIGEIVEFTGDTHYVSASSKTGHKTVPGLAKVTAIYKNGTHQLHLRAINKNGKFVAGVFGWVNVSDVKKIENRTPQIGDIVNFTGNTHYISSTSKIGKPTKPSRAKITAINKAGSHKYHLRAINDAGEYVGGGVYGWVNEDDIELI